MQKFLQIILSIFVTTQNFINGHQMYDMAASWVEVNKKPAYSVLNLPTRTHHEDNVIRTSDSHKSIITTRNQQEESCFESVPLFQKCQVLDLIQTTFYSARVTSLVV